jgi:hypothetical protein
MAVASSSKSLTRQRRIRLDMSLLTELLDFLVELQVCEVMLKPLSRFL